MRQQAKRGFVISTSHPRGTTYHLNFRGNWVIDMGLNDIMVFDSFEAAEDEAAKRRETPGPERTVHINAYNYF